jgi:ribosome biogenesis GTPase
MPTGQVHAIRANVIHVAGGGGRYACRLRGKLKQDRQPVLALVSVGDFVSFEILPGQEGIIDAVQPRRTKLSRLDPHNPRKEQVIVANAEALVAVHSAAQPPLNLVNVDRCLVLAVAADLEAALVVNKMDLAPAGVEAALAPYRSLGMAVFPTSATRGEGLEALKRWMERRTSVLLGPSGAGKSTLLNALEPSLDLKVGEVSRRSGEGTHTTSWVELLAVGGGLAADTPGLEFFSLVGVTQENLHEHFPEFDPFEARCGFTDCRHLTEPRCAVKAAVADGRIAPGRHESYRAIYETLPPR